MDGRRFPAGGSTTIGSVAAPTTCPTVSSRSAQLQVRPEMARTIRWTATLRTRLAPVRKRSGSSTSGTSGRGARPFRLSSCQRAGWRRVGSCIECRRRLFAEVPDGAKFDPIHLRRCPGAVESAGPTADGSRCWCPQPVEQFLQVAKRRLVDAQADGDTVPGFGFGQRFESFANGRSRTRDRQLVARDPKQQQHTGLVRQQAVDGVRRRPVYAPGRRCMLRQREHGSDHVVAVEADRYTMCGADALQQLPRHEVAVLHARPGPGPVSSDPAATHDARCERTRPSTAAPAPARTSRTWESAGEASRGRAARAVRQAAWLLQQGTFFAVFPWA